MPWQLYPSITTKAQCQPTHTHFASTFIATFNLEIQEVAQLNCAKRFANYYLQAVLSGNIHQELMNSLWHCLPNQLKKPERLLRKAPGGDNFVVDVAALAAEVGGGGLGGEARVAPRETVWKELEEAKAAVPWPNIFNQ